MMKYSKKNLLILYYLGFLFNFSSYATTIEKDFESDVLSSQRNKIFYTDEIKLDIYIKELEKYNLKSEKIFFPEKNEVSLTLSPINKYFFWVDKNYKTAMNMLPILENTLIGLHIPCTELTLEELESATNLAKNNPSLTYFMAQNLLSPTENLDRRYVQNLLRVRLYYNKLTKGVINDFNYTFYLTTDYEEIKIIAAGLQNTPSLKNLNLCFNKERGISVIQNVVDSKSICSIKYISFSFFDEKLSYNSDILGLLLKKASSLTSLYLKIFLDNTILTVFCEYLKSSSFSMKNLHLITSDWERSKKSFSQEVLEAFFKSIAINKNLKVLQLNFPFFSISMKSLAEGLKGNNTLKILILKNQKLEDEDIKNLSEGLKENTFIDEVDLSNNNITDEGADSLLELLIVNKNLKILHLANNQINKLKKDKISEILDKRKIFIFNFNRKINL